MKKWKHKRYSEYLDRIELDNSLEDLKKITNKISDFIDEPITSYGIVSRLRGLGWCVRKKEDI